MNLLARPLARIPCLVAAPRSRGAMLLVAPPARRPLLETSMARRSRFTALLLALLGIALMIGQARAHSDDPSNSLTGGSTAIQFQTFGGGYRTPFRTSGIYLKHHLSDRSAVRVGVDFNLDASSGDTPPGTLQSSAEDNEYYSVAVAGEFTRYIDASGQVTVFVGLGPYWQRGRSFNERWQTDINGTSIYTSHSKYEARTWEVGGSVTLGFEWFFRRKLSLLGRVGASVGFGEKHSINQYEASDGVNSYSDTRRFDSDTSTAGSSNAALGLSVYF